MEFIRVIRSGLLNENSLGEPIANEEQTLQRFWDWFDGSKIVDNKGRPLVVYHGTNENFNEFVEDKPIWVTPDIKYANKYSIIDKTFTKTLYVKALNVADLGNIDTEFNEEVAKRIHLETGINESELLDLWEHINNSVWKSYMTYDLINSNLFRQMLKEKGFDCLECTEMSVKTYAVFESNQLKVISNKNYNSKEKSIYSNKK